MEERKLDVDTIDKLGSLQIAIHKAKCASDLLGNEYLEPRIPSSTRLEYGYSTMQTLNNITCDYLFNALEILDSILEGD